MLAVFSMCRDTVIGEINFRAAPALSNRLKTWEPREDIDIIQKVFIVVSTTSTLHERKAHHI